MLLLFLKITIFPYQGKIWSKKTVEINNWEVNFYFFKDLNI